MPGVEDKEKNRLQASSARQGRAGLEERKPWGKGVWGRKQQSLISGTKQPMCWVKAGRVSTGDGCLTVRLLLEGKSEG